MLAFPSGGDKPRSDPPQALPGPRAGEIMVTRGRHAGRRLADTPDHYLQRLVERSRLPLFRTAAAELLEIRRNARPLPPPQDPPVRPPLDLTAYAGEPGAYVMPHGPFKGRRLDSLPDEFLHLVAAKNWHPEVRALAEAVIADRGADVLDDPLQVAPPSAERVADVLPRVAFEFEQKLRAEFEDDFIFVERAVWVLRDIVSGYTGRRWLTDQELRDAAEGR